MAKTSAAGKTYLCGTCGRATSHEGHLCDPIALGSEAAVCEFCGQIASNPRHICFPKRLELTHYCEACGRPATRSALLCAPKPIPKPKAQAKPKLPAAGRSRTRRGAIRKAVGARRGQRGK